MTSRTRVLSGGLLIAVPILFNLFYTLLSIEFSYPDVLRDPAPDVLRRFSNGGDGLIALWYGFALTPVLFLPAALLLRRGFRPVSPLLDLAAPLAILASATQVLGLVRWPYLVPLLADRYLDPTATEASRAATLMTFEAFHRYAGVAVGEGLGYLFTAGWTLVIAAAMLTGSRFRPWLGWMGAVSAIGILVGMIEPVGVDAAGDVNAIAYIVWSVWLIATGIAVLRGDPATESPSPVVPPPA